MTDETTAEKGHSSVYAKAGGVTEHNFVKLAKDYVQANGWWKTINPVDNPQQWGAWLAYRKSKKLGTTLMKQRGRELMTASKGQREESGFTVPANMPSDFDEDRDWLDDKTAGDWFMDRMEKRRESIKAFEEKYKAETPEDRAAFVADAMKGINRAEHENY